MNAYLDSSVILRIVLKQENPSNDWMGYENRVGSQLVELECLRTLDRLRVTREYTEDQVFDCRADLFQLLETMQLLQPSRAILQRASLAFPVAIGTLDAIHLSTAIAWRDQFGEDLLIATHDKGLGKAAQALGFKTEGI